MTSITEPATPSPTAPPTAPARQWDSDGACRCDALRNVWGGRTTHYRSQCQSQTETTGDQQR